MLGTPCQAGILLETLAEGGLREHGVFGRQGCDAVTQFTRQAERPEEEEKGFLHVFSTPCLPRGPEFPGSKSHGSLSVIRDAARGLKCQS